MIEETKGGVPRWLKSTGAVLAGFVVVVSCRRQVTP